VSLWLWASQNAPNGDLSGCSDRAIAEASEYKRKPTAFVTALIKTKWLDEDRKLHDWEEYATLLNDCAERQKENTRERVKRHRERKRAAENSVAAENDGECNAGCNAECNVTDTPGNAPTLPNLTLPYLSDTLTGAAGDKRAQEADSDLLAGIGLKNGEFPGVTRERVSQVAAETEALFRKWRSGVGPTDLDRRMVFLLSDAQGGTGLLDYAFEQAQLAGKVNDWRYIAGIIRALRDRNITTVQQAREWDEDRPDLSGEESAASMDNLLRNIRGQEGQA